MLCPSRPQLQQPFVNDKTVAQLISEPRKVVRITHDRSDPVDASFARLEKDIIAYLIHDRLRFRLDHRHTVRTVYRIYNYNLLTS